MSSSYDFAIEALTAEEIAHNISGYEKAKAEHPYLSHRFYRCNATKDCMDEPQYRQSYRYVTGRAGRTTVARKQVCHKHATAFANKHGLELPKEHSL